MRGHYIYELNRLIKRKCGSIKYCCFRREYVDYSFIEKYNANTAQVREMKKRMELMKSIEDAKNVRYKYKFLKNKQSKNNLASRQNLVLAVANKEEKKEKGKEEEEIV